MLILSLKVNDSLLVQLATSTADPSHAKPPYRAGGSSQLLSLHKQFPEEGLFPAWLQEVQGDQLDHLPSTIKVNKDAACHQ